jgi:hypothetical protein
MIAREVVRIIRELEQEDGETIQQRYGTQARAAAQSIESLIAVRLLEESPHAALWEQFRANPQSAAADLTGVLETLFEADPAFAERIDAFGRTYQEAVQASEAQQQVIESEEVTQVQSDVSQDLMREVAPDTSLRGQKIDQKTYLYGDTVRENEPTTPISQTEGVGVSESSPVVTVFGAGSSEASALQVPQLFEQLQRAIRDNPALHEIDKDSLAVEVQAIRRQILPDEAGLRTVPLNEEDLVRHMENIRRIAPDIADILLNELAGASEDLPGPVQSAVARVQALPED